MTPPNDNEIDTRDPLAIAAWAEAQARRWAAAADADPCGAEATHSIVRAAAYAHAARLIMGFTAVASLREVRHEIYVQGHRRGIVPWEDPEAAGRPAAVSLSRKELARRYELICPAGGTKLPLDQFEEALAETGQCIDAPSQSAGAEVLEAAGWGWPGDGTSPGSEIWETAGTLRRGYSHPATAGDEVLRGDRVDQEGLLR